MTRNIWFCTNSAPYLQPPFLRRHGHADLYAALVSYYHLPHALHLQHQRHNIVGFRYSTRTLPFGFASTLRGTPALDAARCAYTLYCHSTTASSPRVGCRLLPIPVYTLLDTLLDGCPRCANTRWLHTAWHLPAPSPRCLLYLYRLFAWVGYTGFYPFLPLRVHSFARHRHA